MGEENTVRSPPKTSLKGHLRAVKQIITVALDMKGWRVDPGAIYPVYLIGYLQDILCKQANEWEFFRSQNDRDS